MRFSSATTILAALSLTTAVFAAPAFDIQKKDTTPVSVIDSTLTSLNIAVANDLAAITQAVTTAKNSVDVTVIAIVNANLAAIVNAIKSTTGIIVGQTTGAVGGVVGQAGALTQAEIDMLTADLQTLQGILKGLSATLKVTFTNLGPVAMLAISQELALVMSVIQPFLAPISMFVTAVENAQGSVGLTVTGLKNAADGVNSILGTAFQGLGLSF